MQESLFVASVETTKSSWFETVLASLRIEQEANWADEFGLALKQSLVQNGQQLIRTLSLFSGGGGFDIGFHDAGFTSLEMVEIEAKYVATLERNTKQGGLLEGSKAVSCDIRDYQPDFAVDFIIGGPPCQTFSAAGRRAAGVLGTNDPRGMLFWEYVRLLKELRPRGFIFENVYGIVGAQNGEAWQQIQEAFRDAGYRLDWRILDAADYGVPQHRERLFIVGVRDGQKPFLFPAPTHGADAGNSTFFSAFRAIQGADISEVIFGIKGRYGALLNDIPPGLNYSFFTSEMGHPYPIFSWRSKFSDFLYKADPNTPIRTIKAQGGQYTGPFHWDSRKFSIAELKRLQTFPDAYELLGGEQICIQQLGNSVPPQLARMLALSILEQVFNVRLPFAMRYLNPHQELGFRQRKRALTKRYAEIAQSALAQQKLEGRLRSMPTTEFTDGVLQRTLGQGFQWNQHGQGTQLNVGFSHTNTEWCIQIFQPSETINQFELKLEADPLYSWALDIDAIQLCSTNAENTCFTGVWKALEERLLEVTGIADLVQFNGYYQYEPRIRCTVLKIPNLQPWQLLKHVLQGEGIALPLSVQQFADLWDCQELEIRPFLNWLKALGFEVRSQYTNPQLQVGHYLIPYAFPTLNPKSVQRTKLLEETYA